MGFHKLKIPTTWFFFDNSKHGANSIVSIDQDPKPNKVTFFECGLDVERWV